MEQPVLPAELTIEMGLFVQRTQHLLLCGTYTLHFPLDLVQHLFLMIMTMCNLFLSQALNDVGTPRN